MTFRFRRWPTVLLAGALVASGAWASAAAPPEPAAMTFTTLGTNSGPISNPARSEPANLVRYGDQVMLVDVGDGAPEQMARAGVRLQQVQTVIISHLHFDHTGGLFAFLGLRFQTGVAAPLTIYGPPGTKKMVADLFVAMAPGMEVSSTIRGQATAADRAVTVVELTDGSTFKVGEVAVTAVVNSHFVTLTPNPAGHLSLSYRFDAPGRSILYTGDTGPSERVEGLCKGVDLLVSEIMDPAESIARIRKTRPDVPAMAWTIVEGHFRQEHLSPEEVGQLAARCAPGALVLTHNAMGDDNLAPAGKIIAERYKGPVTFAKDLQVF